ncbi:hypothetical protein D3C81_2046150 [compost metagenome]
MATVNAAFWPLRLRTQLEAKPGDKIPQHRQGTGDLPLDVIFSVVTRVSRFGQGIP